MSDGLSSRSGDPSPIAQALASVAVGLGLAGGMALYHVEFGLVRLPLGFGWTWYALGGVALFQSLRIPRLSWRRRGAAFAAAVGAALLVVGVGPVVACSQGPAGGCSPLLVPSPAALVAGIALTTGGTYADLRLGRSGDGTGRPGTEGGR